MAVLPTPGSPIRTGLFFVRRESTWIRGAPPRRGRSGIELALLRLGGQVTAELLEGLVRALGILRGHALAAAYFLERLLEAIAREEVERQQHVLGRDEVVVELPHLLFGLVEDAREGGRRTRLLSCGPLDRRLRGQCRLGLCPQVRDRPPARSTSVFGSSWSRSARIRCSGYTSGLPCRLARSIAAATASCVLSVSLLKSISPFCQAVFRRRGRARGRADSACGRCGSRRASGARGAPGAFEPYEARPRAEARSPRRPG